MSRSGWIAALGGVLLGGVGVAALSGGAGTAAPAPQDRAAIEGIVHDYILAHPEIIPEAMDRLQARQTADKIDSSRKALETPFAGAWAGSAQPDVTLVEFFDYACGFCRASLPDVERLVAEDKKLRVVFRELPILSEASDTAARVSLAAAEQGRFLAFHKAMYAGEKPSAASIAKAQQAAGLDAGRTKAASASASVNSEIEANVALARTLGLGGTPSFVVGNRMLSGAVGYDQLKQAVADARAKKAV